VARQFRYEGIQSAGHLPHGQTWQAHPDRATFDRAVSGQGRSNQARLDQAHPEQRGPDQVAKDRQPGNGSLPEDGTAAGGVVDHGAGLLAPAPYSPDRLFGELSMFYALSTAHRRHIVEQLICRVLQPQDILFSQGATEASLFIIASGVLEVTRKVGETLHVVGRIGPGDYIGEIGLLTGAPHAATVTALTRCITYELRKSVVAPILAEEPNLVSAFEASARHGQELLARAAAAATCPHVGSQSQLLARIRAFFDLPAH
jgi:CRP-like cAMP-binding protein